MGTYDERSVYNKYPLTSNSDDDGCCNSDTDDCSCCPPGLLAVYNEDGVHEGCITPNDAEEYKNSTHIPAEGYVKVYDPVSGEYLGDLPPSQAIELLDYISNGNTAGSVASTFNVVAPEIAASGFYEISYAVSASNTDDIQLLIDRIGITDAVVVSIINSLEDIEFMPSGTSVVIPEGSSELYVQFKWTGVVVGTYTFILEFTTSAVTKQVPVKLTLT